MDNDFEKMIRGENIVDNTFILRTTNSIKTVLNTREGRRFVYDLLGVCHFGRSAYSGEAPYTAHTLMGKQLIGEWVMEFLNNYPEKYLLMINEAKEDQENDRRERDNRANSNNSGSNSSPRADNNSDQPA